MKIPEMMQIPYSWPEQIIDEMSPATKLRNAIFGNPEQEKAGYFIPDTVGKQVWVASRQGENFFVNKCEVTVVKQLKTTWRIRMKPVGKPQSWEFSPSAFDFPNRSYFRTRKDAYAFAVAQIKKFIADGMERHFRWKETLEGRLNRLVEEGKREETEVDNG